MDMRKSLTELSERTAAGRDALRSSMVFTFLWGLAAHGYMLLSSSISHDSLDEFLATEQVLGKKAALGRIFVPAVVSLRGSVSAPWWLGLIGLTCIGLTVYLVVRFFEIREKWMICLTAGIFTTNLTVTALAATYIHDMDCDMLALLFAVLAASCWKKYKWGYLYGAIPLMLTLGLYQSYISMTIVLVVICCMLWLLEGKSFRFVMTEGLKAIAMLACGGILYLCALKCVIRFSDVALVSGRSNSLTRILMLTPGSTVRLIREAWLVTVKRLLTVQSLYPDGPAALIQLLLLGGSAAIVLIRVCSRAIGWPEKVLTLALLGFLPLGANVSHVLAVGTSHDLMYYAIWMVYLLALLLTRAPRGQEEHRSRKVQGKVRGIAAGLVALVLWSNVQVANTVYVEKRFVQEANHSLFTRILYSMEQYEGYQAGQTPVVFAGMPDATLVGLPAQYQRYWLTGTGTPYVVGSGVQAHYQCYLRYVLMNPAVVAPDSRKEELREEIQQMPVYPAKGSIAMIEDTLVVKLGN